MTRKEAFVRKRLIAALVVIAALAGVMVFKANELESQARQESLDRTMSNFLSNLPQISALDSIYQDVDGDLLADPPEDAQLSVKPAELTFAFIASDDSTNEADV